MDWKLIQMVPLQDNPKQSLQYTVVRSKLIFFFERIFQEMLNTLKINERKMEDWRFFVGGRVIWATRHTLHSIVIKSEILHCVGNAILMP